MELERRGGYANRYASMFEWSSRALAGLRLRRRWVALSLYVAVAAMAYFLAYVARFEFRPSTDHLRTFALTLPLLLAIRTACSVGFRLSTGRWRFASTGDVLRLAAATTVGTAVFWALVALLPLAPVVPRSVILIEWVLTGYLTAGIWLLYRTGYERVRLIRSGQNGDAKRVLIIGAGEAGSLLAREMCRAPTGYRPVAFVDDDPAKRGSYIYGLEVCGSTEELPAIIAEYRSSELIIAMPAAPPEALRRIVERCEDTDAPFKILPGIASVLAGDVSLEQLREVRVEDLLGREPVELELPELAADLQNRSVLITGAAGSIGSELARQVALHRPARLILFDRAETELYYLDLELRDTHPDLEMHAVVGDIVDPGAVEQVFTQHRPERVFHAAAYKHVPLMETNAREAVRNNVIGTWRVADAAGRHAAEAFILVSTDKAVRPSSIMGATKRLAEQIAVELQEIHAGTRYGAVRFGNVLGSSGSVIPLFQRQIRQGRPLTVTHPEVTRYFMTIPEAVQLILQASLLPELRGRVAMLEMGEPVRILDLAHKLLRLSGARSLNGGSIVFIGLRPGEKLHEELVGPEEETVPTIIPKVRLVRSAANQPNVLRVRSLSESVEMGPEDAVIDALLLELGAHGASASLARASEPLLPRAAEASRISARHG